MIKTVLTVLLLHKEEKRYSNRDEKIERSQGLVRLSQLYPIMYIETSNACQFTVISPKIN